MSEDKQVQSVMDLACVKATAEEIQERFEAIVIHLRTQAKLRKAKYDILIEEGFTEAQAIEICKGNVFE